MTFEAWLKSQYKRDDIIGDFARYLISSGCRTVEHAFEKYPPDYKAIDAFVAATKEWSLRWR